MLINKDEIYQLDDYSYKNFILLNEKEIKLVWEWRNHPLIRKWMVNSDIIPYEDHCKFVNNLRDRIDVFYWLVYRKGNPVGIVDISDINGMCKSGEPGFYLSPELLDSGEGLFFSYYYKLFFYRCLGFNALHGHILVGNTRALLMSLFLKVKVTGLNIVGDTRYLNMVGYREDFLTISNSKLTQQFVKFIRSNPVDWNKIMNDLV